MAEIPVTMKDIAKILGVSESTVSRAISGQAGVGQKTRAKILALASELQFQPNFLAQGLALQKTRTLGLLLPDITDPNLTRVVKGIEERASQLDYHLILANTGANREKEVSYLTLFRQHQCQGILFVGGTIAEEEILKLGLNNFPVVLINKLLEELALPTLLLDHQTGASSAVNHLLKLGHHHIGLVIGSLNELTNLQLFQGYQASLEQANQEYRPELVIEVANSRTGGYDGFIQLIKQGSPPTAIFAAGEFIVVGVVEAIKTAGYLIPEEIAVVGYGDSRVTEIIHPPLTTVQLPLKELGIAAVDLLNQILAGELVKESFQVLLPELIRRQTT